MFEFVGLGHSVIALLYLLLAVVQLATIYLFQPFTKRENYVLAAGLASFFTGCGFHHLTMMRHGLDGDPVDFAAFHHWFPTAMQVFGAIAVVYIVFPYAFEITKLAVLKRRSTGDRRASDRKVTRWLLPSAHAAGIRSALVGYLILVSFVFVGFQRIERSQRDLEALRQAQIVSDAHDAYQFCVRQQVGFEGLRENRQTLYAIIDGLLAKENRDPVLNPAQQRRIEVLEQGKDDLADGIRDLDKAIGGLNCDQYLSEQP